MEDQSLPTPSVNVNLEFSPVDLNAEDHNTIALRTSGCNDTSEDGEGSQNVLDYPENPRHVEVKNEQQLCQFATVDAWCPAKMPYFNYQNRDGNDLLPSFLKREGYPRDQRGTGMDFNPTTNTLEPGHFLAHFTEQVQQPFAFGPSETLGNAVFMHQNIQHGGVG
ncbi:hypothetical protein Dimus_023146 [Dionaea muscipula]